jgi:hypothetical protein
MFAASFNVGWLNENGEAGHGDRMQPMRRPEVSVQLTAPRKSLAGQRQP